MFELFICFSNKTKGIIAIADDKIKHFRFYDAI